MMKNLTDELQRLETAQDGDPAHLHPYTNGGNLKQWILIDEVGELHDVRNPQQGEHVSAGTGR